MAKITYLCLILILLSSCAVIHEEYFHPQAKGAQVKKQWCRGKVGVDNQLYYHVSNVNIRLEVWEHKGVTRLGLGFEVFDDAHIIWPKQITNVYAEDYKINLQVDSFTRLRTINDRLLRMEYQINSKMDRTTNEAFETYHKSFVITDDKVTQLRIEKIEVIINGKRHIFSDILFTKRSGLFLHPLNC